MSTVSPNMNLILSTVNVDSGLSWEQNLNSSLTLVDAHNHAPGNGVQIEPGGLNINSNLSFQSNSAIDLTSTVYTAVGSLPTLLAVYVIGNELYYNDGAGNVVKLTAGGVVNATSSGISSGTATASFNAGVLVVNSAANTPANVQMGSALLGNNTALSKFLTLSPPAAMAANFTLTLPTIPGSTSFMTMDASGNMGTASSVSGSQIAAGSLTGSQLANQTITSTQIANATITTTQLSATAGIVGTQLANQTITATQIANATITRTQEAAVGQQVSTSSGTFSTTSTSAVDVTNLSISITTTGRPVYISLVADGSGDAMIKFANTSATATATATVHILRGVTVVASYLIGSGVSGGFNSNTTIPSSAVHMLEVPAAATYTYKVQVLVSGASTTINVNNSKLFVYEL